MQRQVRQQRADIESLYDLVTDLKSEVGDLRTEVREGFAQVGEGLAAINSKIDGQLAEILRQLGNRQ